MYVLDTNVISELRKPPGKSDAHVVAWMSGIDAQLLYVSPITLMELESGVLLMERRDPRQGAVLREWLTSRVLPEFTTNILSIDAAVARQCARLRVPDPRPDRDVWIAATALVHGMTVVTRNVADFVSTGVRLLNPWDAPPNR